jgi:hypothetical protein
LVESKLKMIPCLLRSIYIIPLDAQLTLEHPSFAWMEILKAVAIVFKLFDVERMNKEPTVISEGFFNKASECKVSIRRR